MMIVPFFIHTITQPQAHYKHHLLGAINIVEKDSRMKELKITRVQFQKDED